MRRVTSALRWKEQAGQHTTHRHSQLSSSRPIRMLPACGDLHLHVACLQATIVASATRRQSTRTLAFPRLTQLVEIKLPQRRRAAVPVR